MFTRLLSSTTICLLLVLLVADVGFRTAHIEVRKRVDETPLVQRIRNTIADKRINPDVLVVGSSLSYCFTYDLTQAEPPEGRDVEQPLNCAPDKFLTDTLSEKTGKPASVGVISLPGAMATDINNIIQSSFTAGKRPKIVVYLAAPRDFVDRLNAPKKVPLSFGATVSQRAQTLAEKVQSWIAANVPATTIRRIELLCTKPSVSVACELALDTFSSIYEQRSQLRSAVIDSVCALFNRDSDLWAASHHFRSVGKTMTHFDRDLGDYLQRYNPPDFDRFKSESPNLAKLAAACEQNHCELIVVNMPLTTENKRLLDSRLYAQYKQALDDLSARHSATVFDCDQFTFVRKEFIDSAHLNTRGSKRLQTLLARRLASALNHK